MPYINFDLLLQQTDDDRFMVRIMGSKFDSQQAEFTNPCTPLEIENLRAVIDDYHIRRGLGNDPHTDMGERDLAEARTLALALGERLHDAILAEPIGSCWRQIQNSTNRGIRLWIRLKETPDLCDIPWEFLSPPGGAEFLALTGRTRILRCMELSQGPRSERQKPPLRILIVVSNPQENAEKETASRSRLQVDMEFKYIQKALDPLVAKNLVEYDKLESASILTLQSTLEARLPYHVFHFIGHGEYDSKTNSGHLIFQKDELENNPGTENKISGQQLGAVLNDNSLRLAVLNACEGARGGAGVAGELLKNNIPAVVAMQFTITDKAAVRLSAKFYEFLAMGKAVDEALAKARSALFLLDVETMEWATPALYVRTTHEGNLQPLITVKPGQRNTTEAAEPVVSPPSPGQTHVAPLVTKLVIEDSLAEVVLPQDTRVISLEHQVSPRRLSSPGSPRPTQPLFPLEDPDQRLDFDSPYYVERANETLALAMMQNIGNTLIIQAARQFGGTAALVHLKREAENGGKRVAYIHFSADGRDFQSQGSFFRDLASAIAAKIGREENWEEFWIENSASVADCPVHASEEEKLSIRRTHEKTLCTRWLQRELTPLNGQNAQPLVLIFDGVDSLFQAQADFCSDFFALLRSWHNMRAMKPAWKGLDLLISTCAGRESFTKPPHPPFSVGTVIEIDEFNRDQIDGLNEIHGLPFSDGQLDGMVAEVGGHPYIVRQALYQVARGALFPADVKEQALRRNGIFKTLWEQFERRLSDLKKIFEIENELIAILNDGRCSDFALALQLAGLGLVRLNGQVGDFWDVKPRNNLFRRYIELYLSNPDGRRL